MKLQCLHKVNVDEHCELCKMEDAEMHWPKPIENSDYRHGDVMNCLVFLIPFILFFVIEFIFINHTERGYTQRIRWNSCPTRYPNPWKKSD